MTALLELMVRRETRVPRDRPDPRDREENKEIPELMEWRDQKVRVSCREMELKIK